jgi:hypothetical protein
MIWSATDALGFFYDRCVDPGVINLYKLQDGCAARRSWLSGYLESKAVQRICQVVLNEKQGESMAGG